MTQLHAKVVAPSFSSDPRVVRSLRHSVRDGIAYSVNVGAGESYFAAYALLLGATTGQVALLAAVPPLVGSTVQLLAAWLEARLGVRRGLIVFGALFHALTWIPLVGLPIWFPEHSVAALFACVMLYFGWIGLGAPAWYSVMGELVPVRKRGRFFGARTRLMSVTCFIAFALAGLVLHLFEMHQQARLGFFAVFGIAAAARLYSAYHLACMYTPPAGRTPAAPLPAQSAIPAAADRSKFRRFSTFTCLMNLAVFVSAPFFTVFMLRDLNFSYLQFMIATAASIIAQFATLRLWGRLADVFGNRFVLALSCAVIPAIPALWLVSPNFVWIIFVQALGGICWGGFMLAAGNYLYEIVPAEQRTARSATHNVVNCAGLCAGALLGGWVSAKAPEAKSVFTYGAFGSSGIWAAILLSTMLRATVTAYFIPRLQEVRPFRAVTTRALVFRLIPSKQVAGFVLDRLGHGRRRARPQRAALPERRADVPEQ
jgi:MFS family permease